MKKKINLILAAFLLGEATNVLPILWKIIVFVGAALVLFMTYDEWEYSQRIGGAK